MIEGENDVVYQGDGPANPGVGGGARGIAVGNGFLSPALTPGLNWRSFRRSVDVRTAVFGMRNREFGVRSKNGRL